MSIFLLSLGNRTPRNACNPAWHTNSQRFQPSYLCPTGRSLRVCVFLVAYIYQRAVTAEIPSAHVACLFWSQTLCLVFTFGWKWGQCLQPCWEPTGICFCLFSRHASCTYTQPHALAGHQVFSFLLLVTLLGGKVGHVTCPKSLLAPRCQLDSFLRQLFHFPFDCWQIGSGCVCAPGSRKGF